MAPGRVSVTGAARRRRRGRTCISRRSITSRFRIFRRRSSRRIALSRSTKWTRNCCAPTKNSASRCTSRSRWLGSRSTRCSTAYRSARRSRRSSAEAGVVFCSFAEAVHEHPELVRKYLGSVVPMRDNFYATLNSAVFSDGSFVYIPKGVRCPMELSTYFRINAQNTGQFERTLIIADAGSYVSYLEGCTAPQRDEHQLHAAVVELVALDDAQIKYSTVQNWYPGDAQRPRWHLQLRHEAWCVYRQAFEDLVDAGRDRIRDHVEIPERHTARRRQRRRVPLGCAHQQLPAGRYRHEDDSPRPQHAQHDSVEGHQRRSQPELVSRPRAHITDGRRRAQLHAVRFAADRRPLWRAHVSVHRSEPSRVRSSNTKQRRRRSATISCSCASNAASTPNMR